MKYYRVIIKPNRELEPAEDFCAMLRMELTVSVGDNARQVPVGGSPMHPIPVTIGDLIKSTIFDLHISSYMAAESVIELDGPPTDEKLCQSNSSSSP
jgi:hypothetical protein